MTDKDLKTFRFKLSDETLDQVIKFSKIHQFDSRQDYKEAYEKWYQETEIIKREEERLIEKGFKGDLKVKLFKAGRYYFRNKSMRPEEENKPKERCTYLKMSTELIAAMDLHITENISNSDYKPSTGYKDFIEKNNEELIKEISRIISTYNLKTEEIQNKIKKTYKNRYYTISRI